MAGTSDVIIVGGGIIGLAIAREAARAGLSVTLFEKGEPGCEASSAAAGMLCPQVHASAGDPLMPLALASRDLYADFAAAVRAESGVDPRLLDHGTLVTARDEREAAGLDRQHAFQRTAGLACERLDRRGALKLEPALGDDIEGALFLPRDPSIDNAILVRGLAAAAARAGARIRSGAAVTRLRLEGGRIAGVEARGERCAGGAVVVAAGAWTETIGADGLAPVPSHPVRGQIVCLASDVPRRAIFDERCYLVPRGDGRILIGSTMERAGFDKRVTAAALAELTAAAVALVPALRGAAFREAWAGLRPATPDDLPAIGPGPAEGLFYACGHLRNGILLAPITARIVVRLLRGEAAGFDLAPFDPRRFERGRGVTSSGGPSSPAGPGSRA